MRTACVVMLEPFLQDISYVILRQWDHTVQTFPSQRVDESLAECIRGHTGYRSANSTTTERAAARYIQSGTAGALCHGTMSCGVSRAVSIQRHHGFSPPSSSGGSSKSSGSQ